MKKLRFSEYLIKSNNLESHGFDEWVFSSGMLFNDIDKWWDTGSVRCRLHEGVDFQMFKDKTGKSHSLKTELKVPVMFDGEVVQIGNDLLGKSIFCKHEIQDEKNKILHTVYAHTIPHSDVKIGTRLKEGDLIATLADTNGKGLMISPHLHVTTAWIAETVDYKTLSWKTICDSDIVFISDPFDFIKL